ncbi:MAG: hypothetical protein GTO18_18010 [Anaerolineales bacterium]|nr:hypothetical protein [Anaerolineales bacterium]
MNSVSQRIMFTLILCGLFITGCSLNSGAVTSEWQTYVNEVYGYSFKYPEGCFYGSMPSDCKEKPPEERRPECLCFLNGENPSEVFMQAFLGEDAPLTLAGFSVSHYDTPMYNPSPGTELTSWLNEVLSEMYEEIPDEPNMEISGVSAVKIVSEASPMAPSYEEIYYLDDDMLFRINMLDVDSEENRELYDQILSTYEIEG